MQQPTGIIKLHALYELQGMFNYEEEGIAAVLTTKRALSLIFSRAVQIFHLSTLSFVKLQIVEYDSVK